MATRGLVRWWRDGERLLADVEGTRVEGRRSKLEEQRVALRYGPHRFGEIAQEPSRARMPTMKATRRDERLSFHEVDPLLDE